jgi:hypothetical protein
MIWVAPSSCAKDLTISEGTGATFLFNFQTPAPVLNKHLYPDYVNIFDDETVNLKRTNLTGLGRGRERREEERPHGVRDATMCPGIQITGHPDGLQPRRPFSHAPCRCSRNSRRSPAHRAAFSSSSLINPPIPCRHGIPLTVLWRAWLRSSLAGRSANRL